jgi:hypothetical protein
VEGTLPEEEAQKFEDHYFDCPVCFGELQAIQAAQQALRHHPIAVSQPKHVIAWPINRNRMISFGALAAALLIGFFTLHTIGHGPGQASDVAVAPAPAKQSPQAPAQPADSYAGPNAAQAPQPAMEIAELADLRLPSYSAPVLRGGETGNAAFETGMKKYVAGDCASAMNTLSRVEASGPDGLAAQFYSGVCRMHAGDLAAAALTLRHVADAGDSPYQESAFYYLAQIALAQSNAAAARRELTHVVELRGDLEHQARRQLAQIPSGK